MKRTLAGICILSMFFVCGCVQHQGPAEKTGARADEIVDNAKTGKPLLHKAGPMEKAGESVDKTLDDRNN